MTWQCEWRRVLWGDLLTLSSSYQTKTSAASLKANQPKRRPMPQDQTSIKKWGFIYLTDFHPNWVNHGQFLFRALGTPGDRLVLHPQSRAPEAPAGCRARRAPVGGLQPRVAARAPGPASRSPRSAPGEVAPKGGVGPPPWTLGLAPSEKPPWLVGLRSCGSLGMDPGFGAF